ncbi:MAG TPA: hypothetical protein VFX20_18025 [Steroidobacteraceae bacterium]|nr:hypothetical protein [Steroidobacteraceae bacterium]
MRLAKLSEFRRLIYTPESAPSDSTLRRRIDKGLIPGGTTQQGHYYVDLDDYDRATKLRARLTAQQAELAKNPLLAGLL